MQLHPELNNDSSPVFHWYGCQEITDNKGETFKVWIRLVGESDLGQARVYALRKVYELKLKLRDEDSDEYKALIVSIMDLDRDQLVTSLLYFKFQEIVREASKTVKIKYPKEPNSNADIERQSEYQNDLDTWQSKLEEAVQDYVTPRYERIKSDYSSKSYEQIYDEYIKYLRTQICDHEFQKRFTDKCVYLGTFKDEELKISFFNSLEDFENLPTEVKDQFISFYKDLDLSSEELKK